MHKLVDVRALGAAEARAVIAGALDQAGPRDEVLCLASGTGSSTSCEGLERDGRPVPSRPVSVAPGRLLLALGGGARPPLAPSSIAIFMKTDHGRIDALLSAVADAAARGDRPTVELLFAILDEVLRRHAEIEESLLLPVIAARHGQPRGPAAVLRDQHNGILWALEDLGEILSFEGDLSTVEARARALASTLLEHMRLEEDVVYGLADQSMDERERASILSFCEAMA